MWPVISLAMTSLSTAGGSVFLPTMEFGWKFSNYSEAFSKYQDQILRSFGYAIVAFAVLQVIEPVVHGFRLPEWTLSFVVIVLAIGLPVTLVLAWPLSIAVLLLDQRIIPTPPALRPKALP